MKVLLCNLTYFLESFRKGGQDPTLAPRDITYSLCFLFYFFEPREESEVEHVSIQEERWWLNLRLQVYGNGEVTEEE